MLKLLLLEEEKLGRYSLEHVTKLDGHIAHIEELIAKQRHLAAKLNGDGGSATSAEEFLNMLLRTQALFRQHRVRIVDLLRD